MFSNKDVQNVYMNPIVNNMTPAAPITLVGDMLSSQLAMVQSATQGSLRPCRSSSCRRFHQLGAEVVRMQATLERDHLPVNQVARNPSQHITKQAELITI